MYSEHRAKLNECFQEENNALIYLEGGTVYHRYDTDFEYPFRQESNFWYLTGVNEPDFHMLMHVPSGTWHLFVPRRDAQFAVWNGYVFTKDDYNARYKPDKVHYDDELEEVIGSYKPERIYCLDEDSAEEIGESGWQTDDNLLKDALAYCRCIKTDWECNQLRKAADVANTAHRRLMKVVRHGMKEYEMKAEFDYVRLSRGMVHEPYSGIYASGPGSAILHYVNCDRQLKDGEWFLVDAGAEHNGYAADVTRTYPVNGKFTDFQAELYDIVLNAQNNAIDNVWPGYKMEDLHMQAGRDILEGLKQMGLVKGELDELMEKNIFALFFPHGLGHFLGLDTHDVGGYPKGVEKIDRPGLKFLRARRTIEPGMVLTIEPGLYFIPALLKPAFEDEEKSRYLNADKIEPHLHSGGIRIEDNVIVTNGGNENLTNVPKERTEIEALIASEH